jgi:hypothetical protein
MPAFSMARNGSLLLDPHEIDGVAILNRAAYFDQPGLSRLG